MGGGDVFDGEERGGLWGVSDGVEEGGGGEMSSPSLKMGGDDGVGG